MRVLVLFLLATIRNVSPYILNDPESMHCELGDVVQNGRITCTCNLAFIYDCTYKKTPWIPHDKLLLKKEASCQPNKIYVADTTTCICNHDGSWPHTSCADVFNFLPASSVVKTTCKAGAYVFVGCNVCRCGSNGNIDETRCTKNKCDTESHRRRSAKGSSVFGNCEAKNWYSLAPCQFCFCLNENKLVCNTGNHISEKLQLGTYSLNVCGKDLIREAIELIPDDDRSLRHGENTSNTSVTPKTSVADAVAPSSTSSNIEFEIDVDEGENAEENDSNDDRNEERASFSESIEDQRAIDEEDEEYAKMESTQLPFQEDYQLKEISKESEETAKQNDEDEGNTDNEIVGSGLKIPLLANKPPKPVQLTQYKLPKKLTMKNLEELGEQLKEKLPMMLNKVFRLALRKSMVTVNHDSECTPGAVNTVKCNTCFCLKNGKLLCTNDKCENKM